jgi:paraquat-inducible protein B
LPEAQVARRGRVSLVWLIPVVAALIGGWLAFKAYTEKGPTITIAFKTAEGLEAGKTKVKFKDVVVGEVAAIDLNPTLTGVVVTAELRPAAAPYLTDQTRFWVERARVTTSRVSGLGTLFAGAHIALDPSAEGERTRHFVGLEDPPVVTTEEPGRYFVLEADGLGSLNVGSPVYYHHIPVGQVVDYELRKTDGSVWLRIFVEEGYADLVRGNSRFWNASGIDLTLTADGVRLDTESMVSVLVGGVAFETPEGREASAPASEESVFRLFATRLDARQPSYARKAQYLLFFDESVRGLSVGAPVEFRGIRLGEVLDIRLEFNSDDFTFATPVLAEIEPERIEVVGARPEPGDPRTIRRLVAEGLRAQLKPGNLLTGQLYVDLDIHEDAEPAQVTQVRGYDVVPTISAPFEAITASARQVLERIAALPLEEIGNEARDTLQGVNRLVNSGELSAALGELNRVLEEARSFAQGLNRGVSPELQATLRQAQSTLGAAQGMVSADSALYQELKRTLRELSSAARSIRVMADYLERHPDALIYGKGAKR